MICINWRIFSEKVASNLSNPISIWGTNFPDVWCAINRLGMLISQSDDILVSVVHKQELFGKLHGP